MELDPRGIPSQRNTKSALRIHHSNRTHTSGMLGDRVAMKQRGGGGGGGGDT